jgi:hypothetical protein
MRTLRVIMAAAAAFALSGCIFEDERESTIKRHVAKIQATHDRCEKENSTIDDWRPAPTRWDAVLNSAGTDLQWIPWWEAWEKGCVVYRKILTYDSNSCRVNVEFARKDALKNAHLWQSHLYYGGSCSTLIYDFREARWQVQKVLAMK